MTTEAKVGSVTAAAILLLAFMILRLGGFQFGEKGYPLEVVFAQVDGLKSGNLVRYAGVDIGKVSAIEIMPDGIKVRLMIDDDAKIPLGSYIGIGTEGILGERYVSITPPAVQKGYMQPGTVVPGQSQQGLNEMMATASDVLRDIQRMVRSLNDVLGDERVKAALTESALNAKEITTNMREMSAVLARMAAANEGDVRTMVANLSAMSVSMRDVAARVDTMLRDLDNNGRTAYDLREAIANLRGASARVEKMAAALEGVVADPETAENIKETLRNARSVSSKADRMMKKVTAIKVEPGMEMLYNFDARRYSANADIRIQTSPQDFVLLGVNDIGEDNRGNLQIGKSRGRWSTRAGLIDSKAGLGVDNQLNGRWKWSLDAYDPNALKIKLRAQYQFAPQTFVVGQIDKLNRDDDRAAYLGVRRTF